MSEYNNIVGDNAEALRFLRWLRPPGPWVVTAISVDRSGIETRTFGAQSVSDLVSWLDQRNGRDNCYVMVNPPRAPMTKKASKEDVQALEFLHVDCDPPKGADITKSRAEILARLQAFTPPPSAIIDSGGGYQAYWRLKDPLFVGGNIPMAEELEAYNRQLEWALKGDHCFNCDRILRIPGTINLPDKKKRAAGRITRAATIVGELTDISYPLDAFTAASAARPSSNPSGANAGSFRLPLEVPRADLSKLPAGLRPYILMLIVQGHDPDDPQKYKSDSEAQWHVTNELVRAGCDDETIASVLLDPDVAISAHVLRQKNPREYVMRQIARARDENDAGVQLTDFYAYMPMHNYIFAPGRDLWPSSSVNSRIGPVPLVDGAGSPILDENGKPKTIAANLWLDQRRSVEQMTWAPGKPELIEGRLISDGGWIDRPGCNVFNLYRPPRPIYGDASKAGPWLDLLFRLCPESAEHILDWLAHRVQRPEEKINHALVLGGAQGIGKDTLLEPVKLAVGPWNFAEASPTIILGRFNGYVKSVIMRVSEARDLGDIDRFTFYDHMKTYTAAPPDVLRVDEKNLREYNVFNVCGVIITTNHKGDGLYLPEDDRRHFVAWSELNNDDFEPGYWRELWAWYENGGFGHVAACLAERDISGFDPKAPPPKTAAFWEIVASNTAPETSELSDALEALRWPETVTIAEVAENSNESFAYWINDRRNSRKIPHKFEECGYRPVRNPDAKSGRWKVDGKGVAIYARRELSTRVAIDAINRAMQGRRSPY